MKSIYKSQQGKNSIRERYEEVLQYWPAPCEQINISTRYGNTFVMSSGMDSGSAVVLLHGSTTNAAMWMGDAAVLGKTHKVYAVDIIGEPGKSDESRPSMTGGNYATWLQEVFDGLGIREAAVVGNSLGGWMALDLATHAPKRVTHLILLAPGGICAVHASFVLKAASLAMMGNKGEDKLSKIIFGDVTVPKEALVFGEMLKKHYIPRPFKAPVFSDNELGLLTMPLLYMGGKNDPLFPSVKCAQRLRKLTPHADVRVMENTAHTLINMGGTIQAFIDTHPK